MTTRRPAERARPLLAQNLGAGLRTIQIFTYLLSFAVVMVFMFGDPDHHLAMQTVNMAARFFNLILNR